MTISEYINKYEKATGLKIADMERFNKECVYKAKHGFICLREASDKLVIAEMCGDGLYWYKFAKAIAKDRNKHFLEALIVRDNIEAFIKTFNCEIIDAYEMNGKKIIECVSDDGDAIKLTETRNALTLKPCFHMHETLGKDIQNVVDEVLG